MTLSGKGRRRKGSIGERELVKILAKRGFAAQRTPYSGGGTLRGDLIGKDLSAAIPGYHLECKRQENLCLPAWLRQSYADSGHNIPTVIFRRNNRRDGDPLGLWHICLPLEDFLADQAELRELRRERAA